MEEDLKQLIRRHRDELHHTFGSILEEGSSLGEFRRVDSSLAVTALLGMLNGQIAAQLLESDEEKPIQFTASDGKLLLHIFLDGINARADTPESSAESEDLSQAPGS